MEEVYLFILTFITALIIYQIFVVSRTKKRRAKKDSTFKDPVEIMYLVNRYRLDLKMVDYDQLLQVVAIVSSFDIAITITIILLFDNFILEIVGGMISLIFIILISYHMVYLLYKKKGMIKND